MAAAFIGPGTVTTATLAGARFGTALLWALLFSTLATMALQEMAARLGLVSRQGLGEAIRARFQAPAARFAAVALVVAAIAVGNAAYETGNLLGGALGLQALAGGDVRVWAAVAALLGFALLWSGSYRVVQRFMVAMVGLMSVTFLATAVRVLPEAKGLLPGLVLPSLPPARSSSPWASWVPPWCPTTCSSTPPRWARRGRGRRTSPGPAGTWWCPSPWGAR